MTAENALATQSNLTLHLNGAVCSQVSLGGADALIIDFGELQESPEGQLIGSLTLAIDCPWRIDTPNLPVVGWEDEEEDIAHLVTVLIGASVEEVEVRLPGYDLFLDFSNEHRLRVFPDCRAYFDDDLAQGVLPWLLMGPSVTALSGLAPDSEPE